MEFWSSVFGWIVDWISVNWKGVLTHGISYLIGITGIVIAILCRTSYRLCFQKSCIKLIDGALPSAVKITVYGKAARRLSATKIVVWNSGYRALKWGQVSDPMTISFREGDHIYKHDSSATKASNKVHIRQISDHVLRVEFRNLDRNDGMALDILHDSEMEYPCISGTILEHKGFKDCGEIKLVPNRMKLLAKIAVTTALLVIPGIIILITAGFESNGPGLIAFGLLYLFLLFWRERQRIPRPLVPHILA